MEKVINIGQTKEGERFAQVFCKVKIEDGKLSISGVIGPLPSGNARGSCGQIYDSIKESRKAGEFKFDKNWTSLMLDQLLEVWDEWHLNDMRAGCEHQRAENWGDKKVQIETYRLNADTSRKQDEMEKNIKAEIIKNGRAAINKGGQELLGLPYSLSVPAGSLSDYMKQFYELKNSEEKSTGWLSEAEHPEGVLSKACPTCGYKYGSSWKRVELPEQVINFINALPVTERVPAWV